MRQDEAEYIEAHYDVTRLQVNGHPIWVYLRMVYHAYFVRRSAKYPQTKTGRLRTIPQTLSQLFSCFYGNPFLIFLRKPYVVFSDAAVRKKVKDHYIDKQFEYVIEKLGSSQVLCVESLTVVHPTHYPRHLVPTKHLMSYSLFLLASLPFWILRKNIKGQKLLKELVKTFQITLNHPYFFKNFLAQHAVLSLWLKWYRPKAIFINAYYGKMPLIKAAKTLNIPVIEIQHGLIEADDIAYFARRPGLDLSYFPDYFLCFGEKEKQFFLNNQNPLIPPAHVFPVGNYLLEYVRKQFKPDPMIQEKAKAYKTVIAVSGQDERETDIIAFLNQVSQQDSDLLFLYVPRRLDQEGVEKQYSVTEHILIIKHLTVYETVLHASIHTTVHSTCAIEALSLGVRNILMDLDGIASDFFAPLLEDRELTQFAKTPQEYLQKCHHPFPYTAAEVAAKNENNISVGFCDKIDAFLSMLQTKA